MTIKSLRHQLGLRLRRRMHVPLQELALERLRKAGLRPRLLLDVGASSGVFADEAWSYWPDLSVHCFEPEPEFVNILQERAQKDSRLSVCQALVGAGADPAKLYYHVLGASTICRENRVRQEHETPVGPGPERKCPMITLDTYCHDRQLKPDFLKIDVQGYELEVLHGAEGILPGIEVVLTEVNHLEVYDGAPLAAELIGYLAQRGYALHDVCDLNRRPLDDALWQTDMVFVRHTSPLRARRIYRNEGRILG
jgi:FkbM family methyltransferase